jgi:hypothetical protein
LERLLSEEDGKEVEHLVRPLVETCPRLTIYTVGRDEDRHMKKVSLYPNEPVLRAANLPREPPLAVVSLPPVPPSAAVHKDNFSTFLSLVEWVVLFVCFLFLFSY